MTFEIKLDTLEEVNTILAGLGKLPLEQALPVWKKVREQAEGQLKEMEPPCALQSKTV